MQRPKALKDMTPAPAPAPAELVTTLDAPRVGKLPRGTTSLPKDVVEHEQRRRLVAATAKAVAAKGYAEATISDIIGLAGVSRATFYQLYVDKEDCFLYGYRKLSESHVKEVGDLLRGGAELPDRLSRAMRAYMRRIDLDQDLARAFVAEAEGASPRIRAEFLQTQQRLASSLREWLDEARASHPTIGARSDADLTMVMHGLHGFVVDHVRRGRPFANADVADVLRFVFAGLGLYGWATHAAQEATRRSATD